MAMKIVVDFDAYVAAKIFEAAEHVLSSSAELLALQFHKTFLLPMGKIFFIVMSQTPLSHLPREGDKSC